MIALTTTITYTSNSLPDFIFYTNKIKEQYCKKFNNCEYIFKCVQNNYNTFYVFKFDACKDLINSKKYNWIIVMDSDAVPYNFNVNVEDWLNKQQKKIIIGKDCNGINAGIIAIPCIDKSIIFLDKFFKLSEEKKFNSDQDIIKYLIQNEFKEFYLEPDKDFGFNNYVNWKCKGINEFIFGKSWGLHLPDPIGMRTPRLQYFKKMYELLK